MKKVALITGGSGQLGDDICHRLSDDGYLVILHYCSGRKRAEDIKKSILNKGGDCHLIECDFSKPELVQEMFTSISEKFKRIDVLVNNAGLDGGRFDVANTPLEVHQKVMAVNYFSAVECIRLATIIMRRNNMSGVIVNVSSQAAVYGGYQLSHYAASKAALVAYSIGAARDLMKDDIRLNNISPGVLENSDMSLERKTRILSEIPASRLVESTDVSNTISWLVSDQSKYISGITLPISGAR
ncbi:SDR family NAD(P)-dependent oxidoreductase [Marinomonas gallaica]|uniref:SDR family NAD(P)-dependent oxidoreductase n=1 Tax=Marinomonas gallaica TaxID=1806667 RepID=UPI003A9103AD